MTASKPEEHEYIMCKHKENRACNISLTIENVCDFFHVTNVGLWSFLVNRWPNATPYDK